MMSHQEFEDWNFPERYLQGKLSEEEQTSFEEHLFECGECFERVRWDDELKQALSAAASEDITRAVAGAGVAALVNQARLRYWAPLVLGVLVAALPSAFYLREKGRAEDLTAPRINTPIFTLGAVRTVRGGDTEGGHRLTLRAEPEWIVLRLELPLVQYREYRATLYDVDGEPVWQQDGLVADSSDAVVISLYSSKLTSGDGEVHVEGLEDGRSVSVAEFPFRTVRER